MSGARTLDVRIQGQRVGHLVAAGGRVGLRLSDAWRGRPDRQVLSLSLEETDLADLPARPRLPAFFDNLLPEGELRSWLLASEHLPDRDLDLLARLGGDLFGAVTLEAVEDETPLHDDASDAPAPRQSPADGQVHWSLAGVQLKLNLRLEGASLTLPVRGQAGTFIAKLPDRRFAGVPETEHATMSWAAASGIDVAPTELLDPARIVDLPPGLASSDEPAILVRRFDRSEDGSARIHCEEFAQAMSVPAADKYQGNGFAHQLKLVQLVCPQDVGDYLRRLLFVVLSGNADAHHKNWAMRYPDGRRPRLAPAYDQVAIVRWSMEDRTLRDQLPFKLGFGRRFEQVHLSSFLALLDRVGVESFSHEEAVVRRAQAERWLRDQARQILDNRGVADRLGGAALASALDRHQARVPLVREL